MCCKCCGIELNSPIYDYCDYCFNNCREDLKELYEGN